MSECSITTREGLALANADAKGDVDDSAQTGLRCACTNLPDARVDHSQTCRTCASWRKPNVTDRLTRQEERVAGSMPDSSE
jgi:hypothetical protein